VGAGPAEGQWRIGWRIQNLDAEPLELDAAWLPHGRFRCARQSLVPPRRLPRGQRLDLEFVITTAGAPGEVVENAFLVLNARRRGEPWQLFARIRVTFDASGAPRPATELVTAQPLGFSHEVLQ
jgi:hypothetical protein